eukprot:5118252-Amphidinium_carterae.1
MPAFVSASQLSQGFTNCPCCTTPKMEKGSMNHVIWRLQRGLVAFAPNFFANHNHKKSPNEVDDAQRGTPSLCQQPARRPRALQHHNRPPEHTSHFGKGRQLSMQDHPGPTNASKTTSCLQYYEAPSFDQWAPNK